MKKCGHHLTCRAFTLLEVLVSFALLSVISLALVSIVNSTGSIWRQTKGKVETFRESRAAFETIVQRLSQATLNTYWGFDDPNDPGQYVRLSELHFVIGPAATLLGTSPEITPTSAVFFQAPLGSPWTSSRLENLLNEVGYFIEFGADTGFVPQFLQGSYQPRYRYRLMEYLPPTTDLQVYQNPTSNDWFKTRAMDPNYTRPIAENIVALVIRPRLPEAEDPSFAALSGDFTYDSRDSNHPTWVNQLPPVLDILMVAIDEASAEKIANGSTPPLSNEIPSTLFTSSGDFEDNLKTLRDNLRGMNPPINFRIFQTTIAPREAKWSP